MQNSVQAQVYDDLPSEEVGANTRTFLQKGRFWFAVKRFLDVVIASFVILLAAPLMALIWVLVRRDGGPGFFAHRRIGRNGREFGCLKFRTMVVDSDAALTRYLSKNEKARIEWDQHQKLTADPRVTRLGRLLRSTSLDELPQLFNIFTGDMSLVGPRPVVHSELQRFYGSVGRAAYFTVRPGLTGLWQVSGRSGTGYERRVELDVAYVEKSSFVTDIAILGRTVGVVLGQKGAH